MTLYSKNGSFPKPETDGTEGWIEVPDQPECPDGKEVVWWFPPGWVVRDTKPEQSIQTFNIYDINGNVVGSEEKMADWSWSQSETRWVAYPLPIYEEQVVSQPIETSITASATGDVTLSSPEPSINLSFGTASDSITGASE